MGKTRRGQKEFSREQQLRYENHKLRREISSLRKQLARIDLDRHGYVKNILEEHYEREEREESAEKILQKMKDVWQCKECGIGHLEINLYTKLGETWYYRACNHCDHRTKSQAYHSETVQGPMKSPSK